MPYKRRAGDNSIITKYWQKVRPYYYILTFVIMMTFLATSKWARVEAYDGRIISLEDWRILTSSDLSAMRQEVKDIHNFLIPNR